MTKKIEKQGQVAAQARVKADSEFEKLLELQQEHQKLKQEMTAKKSAGTVICCCWEYVEILGACKTDAWKSIPTAALARHSDGEPRSGGRTDSDENQKRRERQTHLHHEEDGV